jgi:hypothetical protein
MWKKKELKTGLVQNTAYLHLFFNQFYLPFRRVFEKTESLSSKKWRRAMRAYIDSGFNSEIPAESRSACAKYACDLYKEFSSRVSPAANEVPGSSSQEN